MKAELIHCNPQYAEVRLNDGRETTVSLRDVAPYSDVNTSNSSESIPQEDISEVRVENSLNEEVGNIPVETQTPLLRRSSRPAPPPIDRLGYPKI